jgi:hypothetical protein
MVLATGVALRKDGLTAYRIDAMSDTLDPPNVMTEVVPVLTRLPQGLSTFSVYPTGKGLYTLRITCVPTGLDLKMSNLCADEYLASS